MNGVLGQANSHVNGNKNGREGNSSRPVLFCPFRSFRRVGQAVYEAKDGRTSVSSVPSRSALSRS